MEVTMKIVKKEVQSSTTNYPKDSHKEFCRRCMAHNRGCPANHGGAPSKSCSL